MRTSRLGPLKLGVLILVASANLLRPTALGNTYTEVGLVLGSLALFLILLRKQNLRMGWHWLARIGIGFALFLYLLVQGWLTNSVQMDFVLKSTFSNLISLFIFGFALADDRINFMFFRILITLWALLGISSAITTVLSFGIDLDSVYLGQIVIKGYNDKVNLIGSTSYSTGRLYFPLSLYYTHFASGGLVLHRFMNVFREPGIASAFLLWGVVYTLYCNTPKWLTIGLLLGIVTTYSTSGLALLLSTIVLYKIWRSGSGKYEIVLKIFVTSASIIFVIVAVLYMPYIGIMEKNVTHRPAIDSRLLGIQEGLNLALEKPFGVGFYNQPGNLRAGINLLAISGQIGIVGLLFAIFIYWFPVMDKRVNGTFYFLAVLPIFATALLSQPLLDAPLVYIMVLFTKSFDRITCHDEK